MEVIILNKKILKIFGMCLDDENASSKERTISKCVNWTMLWISICTIGVSLEYVISHFSDTESILFAVMQIAANTASGRLQTVQYKEKGLLLTICLNSKFQVVATGRFITKSIKSQSFLRISKIWSDYVRILLYLIFS